MARTQTETLPSQSANELPHQLTPTSTMELEQLTGSQQTNVAQREDVPPDGGYGWVVAACVFLINAHTWRVNSAWGVCKRSQSLLVHEAKLIIQSSHTTSPTTPSREQRISSMH